jgi:hypothetical protein
VFAAGVEIMFRQSVMTIAFVLAARMSGAQIAGLPPRDNAQAHQVDSGAIRGRVVDGQAGNGLSRARLRLQGPAGLRTTVVTGEAGNFAFTGLPPGRYSLNADKSTYLPGRYPESGHSLRNNARLFFPLLDGQILNVTVPLFHGGAISGRAVDSHGEPVEFASVQVIRVPRPGGGRPAMRNGGMTNDLGEFRVPRLEPGNYLLLVQPRPDVQEDGPTTQSVPTLYPGVLMGEQAVPIAVERGASVTGLELTLVEGTMSRVRGTLVDSTGRPAIGGFVNVRAIVAGLPDGFDAASAPVGPDGTFELKVAPGEYQIEGRAVRPGTVGPVQAGDQQIGMARLSVTGEAHSGVTIVLGRGATVTGRVVFEGSTPTPPMPANPGQFRVSFNSPDRGTGCRMGRSDLGANWTFSVDGLLGTCVAQVSSSLGLLRVKAVMVNDVDLMDQPVTFQSGQQLRNVEVIVTDKQTDLTFHVTDAQGLATREYVALVFSIDKARWFESSRYIRTFVPAPPVDQVLELPETATPGAAPVTTARESVAGLPPGEYHVVALDDLESEGVPDPALLDSLKRVATRVTLTDRGGAEVSLRVVTLSNRVGER